MRMEWQTLTAAETAAKLKTDPVRGLSCVPLLLGEAGKRLALRRRKA